MEFVNLEQTDFDSIKDSGFDVLIMVSGYEQRCTYLAEKLHAEPVKKLVFAFLEKNKEGHRSLNDLYFKEHFFEIYESSGSSGNIIQQNLDNILEGFTKEKIRILVDYSCMTKEWYATIINYFVNWDVPQKEVELFFSYTPSVFEKSKKTGMMQKFKKSRINNPDYDPNGKAVSLVIGLGYNQGPALELISRLRPLRTYVFYSDPCLDERFVEEVENRNKELLQDIAPEFIFKYPVGDIKQTNHIIKDLCMDLRLDSQVILAPLGPKPFALSSMLLSARYPDIWVWRVHSSPSDKYYEMKAVGDPVICRAMFKKEGDSVWR